MDKAVRKCVCESNNAPDKGEFLLEIPTKIPSDFRSKEVVISMDARIQLSHLERSLSSPAVRVLVSFSLKPKQRD